MQCPACGNPDVNSAFCTKCGAKTAAPPRAPAPQQHSRPGVPSPSDQFKNRPPDKSVPAPSSPQQPKRRKKKYRDPDSWWNKFLWLENIWDIICFWR